MRLELLALACLVAGCTKHNSLVCCVAADDCMAIGAAMPEPCPNGLACVMNECQMPPDASIDAAPDAHAACTMHSDCGSPGACLPDGSCGTNANVAWVAQGGTDSGACTQAQPCATVTHALLQNKPFIKVANGSIADQPTIQQDVTIVADPDASLVGTNVGPMVTVAGTHTVTIYDLTISQGPGTTGYGIYVDQTSSPTVALEHVSLVANGGYGIFMAAGTLTASRCTIYNNHLGGIMLQSPVSTFDITNCFIIRNGNASTGTGGVVLVATNAASSRFGFNTVVDNQLPNVTIKAGGVTCDMALALPNNVLARNYVNNDPSASNANHVGACTYPTSADQPSLTGLNFLSPDMPPYDYHLGAGSTAIDQGTTSMAVDIDVDGDHRPQGAAKDQGADEYK